MLKLHERFFQITFFYSNKVKIKIKHYISNHLQHCFWFMLHFRVYNQDSHPTFTELVYFAKGDPYWEK